MLDRLGMCHLWCVAQATAALSPMVAIMMLLASELVTQVSRKS
jgi:hypothetical protein